MINDDDLRISIEYIELLINDFLENMRNKAEYLKSYRIEHVVDDLDYYDWIVVKLEVDESLYIMEKLLDETIDLKSQLLIFFPSTFYRIKMIINGKEV